MVTFIGYGHDDGFVQRFPILRNSGIRKPELGSTSIVFLNVTITVTDSGTRKTGPPASPERSRCRAGFVTARLSASAELVAGSPQALTVNEIGHKPFVFYKLGRFAFFVKEGYSEKLDLSVVKR